MERNGREWWEDLVMVVLGAVGAIVAMVLMF